MNNHQKLVHTWRSRVLLRFPAILALVAAACTNSHSGSDGVGGSGSGGGSRGGGSTTSASGGTSSLPASLGGSVGSGGTTGKGGTIGSGGASGSGGVQGSGGRTDRSTDALGGASSGGSGPAGSGGTTATGGRSGMGGISEGGGSTAMAGSTENGGGTGGGARDAGIAGTGGGATGGATGGSTAGSTSSGSGDAGTATCPAGSAKPTEGKKTVMVGTTSRTYYLHVPAKYDGTKPAPLVVDFHGLGGTGAGEAGSNPYKPVIDPEGVISAYPDGAQTPSGTGWNAGLCCGTVDDVAFARALVQDVEKMACIDPKRVYAVGFSFGGGMTQTLACRAADLFAAAAPAAADLSKEDVDSCKPTRPITVIMFRGTADTAVPYNGGSMTVSGTTITTLGAKTTFQKWAGINQCTGTPSAEDSNGCSTYSSCASGVQVTLCTKQGGGHEAGNATVAWPVLKKYTLP